MPPTIPVPPIPPSGASPSPAVSTRGDEDPLSPTVMLQSYLRSKGMPLTPQNMQRALEANARGGNVIPGLESDVPSSDPGVGQSGNVAGQVEKAPTPSGRGTVDEGRFDVGGEPTNKTPPASTGGDTSSIFSPGSLGALILGAAGGGGAGYLASRMRGGSSAPPSTGIAGAPPATATLPSEGGNPLQSMAERLVAANPNASAEEIMAKVRGAQGGSAQTGNRFDVNTPAQTTDPLEAALSRAVPDAPLPARPQGPTSPSGASLQVPRPPMPDRTLDIPPAPTSTPVPTPAPTSTVTPPGMVRNPDGSIVTPRPFGTGRVAPRYVPSGRLTLRMP